MRVQAHAKINWALNILGARPDGYHEMDMLMQSISLCDELVVEPADALRFDGDPQNLVLRAARALNAHMGADRGAAISLIKRIPERAGLGGGSADAAAVLVALNRMWGLGLSSDELLAIGLSIGADVPFCVLGGVMRARVLGEMLEPVKINQRYELVILHPGGGLSTPEMFCAWDGESAHTPPADIEATARALQTRDFALLARSARNMLYGCAVRALREVEAARRALLDAGAPFAAMTGSGSAMFGAFPSAADADAAAAALGPGAIRAHTV